MYTTGSMHDLLYMHTIASASLQYMHALRADNNNRFQILFLANFTMIHANLHLDVCCWTYLYICHLCQQLLRLIKHENVIPNNLLFTSLRSKCQQLRRSKWRIQDEVFYILHKAHDHQNLQFMILIPECISKKIKATHSL